MQIGAWAAALLLMIGGAAWGYAAMNAEDARRSRLAAAIAQAEQTSQNLPLDRIAADDELVRVLPYLDSVRALPAAARSEGAGLGLSQEPKLVEAGDLAYEHALDRVLLPRLLAGLENQIRAGCSGRTTCTRRRAST